MVVFDAGSGSRSGTLASGMRVIKAEQPLAILIMKRQRVIQAVRSLGRNGNLFYNKLDPTLRIRDEAITVELQERVEAWIANCHCHMLSLGDNTVKPQKGREADSLRE